MHYKNLRIAHFYFNNRIHFFTILKFSLNPNLFSELTRLHAEMENIRLECARLMNQRSTTPKNTQKSQQATNQTQAQQALSLMNMIEKLSSSVHQSAK